MKQPCIAWLVASLVASGATGGQEPNEGIEIVRVIAPLTLDSLTEGSTVQAVLDDEIDEQHRLTLADYLRANLASVFVNEAQSNPLQPDLHYRGFVASPLLGLPQGLAVYQDGVRGERAVRRHRQLGTHPGVRNQRGASCTRVEPRSSV